MKNKSKLLLAAGVTLVSASVLAACGNGGNSSSSSASTTYNYVYQSEPVTLDYVKMNQAGTSDITANLIDGLLENDQYGNLIPSLAEDWKVSEDGLTYTYTLREDAKWYTADGEEYADVTAEDFVTGLKHAADSESEALYVIQDSIKGLQDYLDGKTTDFSTVGVKAVDERTVQYTLNAPESYWNSKLTYSIMFPINAEFLESKGEDFGKQTDPESLLYNGPYLLKSITAKSSMEFEKNANYWDADNVFIDNVKLTYYDGSDQDSLFNNFDEGAYTAATLFPTSPSYKTAEKKYGDNIVYGQQDGATYMIFFNLNRTLHNLSDKTDEQLSDSNKAMNNKDFRQAVSFAFDRASWNAQVNGEEAKEKALRNTLVPPAFVQIEGKEFGDSVTAELASYGDEWKDIDLSDGQDGLYNPEKAQTEFAKAKEALEAEGVSFPIQLDFPVSQTDNAAVQRAQSMKQSVEASLGKENVVINLKQVTEDEWLAATYQAETPEQNDYDLALSGWSPDYADPSSYLDIFGTTKGAATTPRIGISYDNEALIKSVGLDKYQDLLNAANALKDADEVDARYEAYAKAQAWLTDSAVAIPTISKGARPTVTKVVPFTRGYSYVGVKGESTTYKYMKLQDEPVTVEQYDKALAEWEEAKEKSNAEAAEALADHIEK
ncbi:oligopeptide transport system substrate-binding protein [Streptococcus henryi]|jgi:oligopeptide transport system substrate-binding protein|uniref:Oligopeptide transport system substrate-binding protein n=1 Tax=Streptococcus henryi TaxID=439219 RepID=A0A1G6B2R5_9STRE|nr:peptide ABC transporter substrate-binding protein [Streptococcus henryi]SDB14905.1 oligopeptide transport system substrate-binding protein [Streptococcus henryi]